MPIYQQIGNQITFLIASGRLIPGDELPSIRALGEQLLVNPNTVARVYRELEMEGIVEKHRTAGTYIAVGAPEIVKSKPLSAVTEKVDELMQTAQLGGINTETVVALIRKRSNELE